MMLRTTRRLATVAQCLGFLALANCSNRSGGAAESASLDGGAAASADGGVSADPLAPQAQWFYAGGDFGTLLRQERIPNQTFVGFDGKTPTDPIEVMANAGFNAVRVETEMGQCAGPSTFDNGNDVINRELTFTLDWGCIDLQVETARQARAKGMKVILTLNMGSTIPTAWTAYSYTQMLTAIDGEVARQLTPFMAAGIQPDIILLENEGTDGFLFDVTLASGTVHARGIDDGNVSAAQLRQELCGQLPTGNIASYPQLAGYYKQEVTSATAVLAAAGFHTALTRFGLHSHGQYFDWKQSIVYSTATPSNEATKSVSGTACDFTGVIPEAILSAKASDVLDIMGYSGYPDPMTPADPTSAASIDATFGRLRASLAAAQPIVERYGKVTAGPFTGQSRKQMLAVEFATAFDYPSQTANQVEATKAFFAIVQQYDWYLGAMWYEPAYSVADWEGGKAALYYNVTTNGQYTEIPLATLTTWGSFAKTLR